MEQIGLFDEKFKPLIGNKISTVLVEDDANDVDTPIEDIATKTSNLNIPSKALTCSFCRVDFEDNQQQREHYKLDWHRYNLKQNLLGRVALTEDQFQNKADDLSSISGSDSEKEEDTIEMKASALGKVFLKSDNRIFTMYRCILADKKVEIDNDTLLKQLNDVHKNNKWTIMMLGGGHFAGAIFNGAQPILHKTFHCYTVRAGQGGSQSSRDNRNASSAPKSAGASLRRYNESAFIQHVYDIVENWRQEIADCNLIMYRAAGPYNRSVLFGGKSPILDKSDSRLRSIPFTTRRPTFSEVKRVHALLSTVQVYTSLESATEQYTTSPRRDNKRGSPINRSKSREIKERQLPCHDDIAEISDDDIVPLESETSMRDVLQPYDDSIRQDKKERKKRTRKSKAQKAREQEEKRKLELYNTIVNGDLLQLRNIFKCNHNQLSAEMEQEEQQQQHDFVNEVIDDNGNTLLHIAALNEQENVITFLLESNADLCVRNKKQQTPYCCTQSKDIRELFKNFARENPDKFNYNKAQIPMVHADKTQEELVEKKKQQKKVKREKEKERKKEKDAVRKEEEDKTRFANLSDREKRALAAERRIFNQSGMVIARCFLCGSDMTGKVPFEYLNNRFCTMDCLKAHRMKNPIVLS